MAFCFKFTKVIKQGKICDGCRHVKAKLIVGMMLTCSLESNYQSMTLCILANVADGDSAKDFIMGNEDVLKKLMNYMMHSNVNLQIAATFCICNLIWNEEESASERQAKLTELGVHKLLQQLLSTNNTTLFDKVKTAMQQFT
ncbi:armadillo repeat-containing protein 8-like [Lingula anatina]|uniref:Armadillo repeat-containing protein 8-like n=1 Tax=Lingula anatina TaxID=7574 RepID=A0A2R2MMP7_LINAN|nr:armadillo repeat-containing protein 8-like [Lingula anatina]|eukprot:XP_023931474.1 armadillo repeat-containing protein 8-like [Lingula anatina]